MAGKSVLLMTNDIPSLVALAMLKAGGAVLPLTIDEGQEHTIYLESVIRVCDYYNISSPDLAIVPLVKFDNTPVAPLKGLALLASGAMRSAKENAVTLVACHTKDKIDAQTITILDEAINYFATKDNVFNIDLSFPFSSATLAEVIRQGEGYSVPFDLVNDCDNGVYPLCGTCASCSKRKKAFLEAGVTDTAKFAV